MPRTHDCFSLARKAEAPENVVENADKVSPYYFRTRYPDVGIIEIKKEDISRIANAARGVMEWIENYWEK